MGSNHSRPLCVSLLLLVLNPAAFATTWYVNGVSGSDSKSCTSATMACKTIGHAISLAASADTIRIAGATYTENLTIAKSLTIVGSSANTTVVDGGGVSTVVTISSATHVSLSKLKIQNGNSVYGGGINNSGTLIISRSIVSNNIGGDGAGLWNGGILTINNSTISSNGAQASCTRACGAFGGGIYNSGATLTINNSTISSNEARVVSCSMGGCAAGGGGIFNYGGGTLSVNKSTISGNAVSVPFNITRISVSAGGGIGNAAKLNISNCTLSGNTAMVGSHYGYGGGINNTGTAIISNTTLSGNNSGLRNDSGSTILQNSIVARNSSKNCVSITSNGYNLSSDGSCNFSGPGDMNNTNPKLGPLQDNGGPTQTMALPSGSPAIDGGNPSGCTDGHGHVLKTDQRGMPRHDPEDSGGCDIGAYESQID